MSSSFDHRQLAGEMELYFFDERIGAGLPVWLPRGVAIRDELESFVKSLEHAAGYRRIASPHLARSSLYERSGHLAFFREDMFPPLRDAAAEEELFLRPMNCPHHHLAFASAPRSYRQLPLRLAEFGQVYRRENSGSLQGLARARGLCQNDAHIYLDPSQAAEELAAVLRLHERVYRELGLDGYRYRLSRRAADRPELFGGEPELWERSEELLRQALRCLNLPFFEAIGEAAFYGPKIDVQMRIGGKEMSVASVQLDFLSAERFDLAFIDAAGARSRPWVIHRAPLGSLERFVALLLERFQGRFPAWLAPVQLFVLPVLEAQREFSRELVNELLERGLRAELHDGAGSLSKRLRAAHAARPFALLVVGEREAAGAPLRLQLRDGGEVAFERCNLLDVMRKELGSDGRNLI